mmetsp:Transcript_69254/g.129298  ORF Transcript_69254/g.129298 Transcript_69254/m.129298 type:complete len:648 (-) Transcript_69254:137-2080(-)
MVDISLGAVIADVPKDVFLSLRVGDVQKFAKASSSRAYKFPASAVAQRRYGRLEIYRRIGSGNIVIDPSYVQGLQELTVPLEDTSMPSLTFRYEATGSGAGGLSEAKQKQDLTSQQQEVQDYLLKHQVEQQMLEAMQALISVKPDDPMTFISQRLLSGVGKINKVPDARDEGGTKRDVPAQPRREHTESAAPRSQAEAHPGDSQALLELQARMACELDKAGEDGRLAAALQGLSEVEALRKKTQGVFLDALTDGSLENILRSTVSHGSAPATNPEEHPDKLRAQARQTLAAATGDGSLAKALANIRGTRPQSSQDSKAQAPKAGAPAATVESLRDTTRSILAKAIDDGSLADALSRVQAEREQEERGKEDADLTRLMSLCRDALVSGAEDGTLDQALAVTKEETAQTTMDDARQALLSAGDNGLLDAILTEVTTPRTGGQGRQRKEEPEAQTTMEDARQALLEAGDNGLLDAILTEVTTPRTSGQGRQARQGVAEVDDLRQRCRDVLLGASTDGRLADALAEVATSEAPTKTNDEELRRACRDTLVQASMDGRLDSVLEGVGKSSQATHSSEESINSLRSSCRDVLIKACEDGSLAAELRNIVDKDSQTPLATTSEEVRVLKEENVEMRRTIEDLKVAVKRLEEQRG